MEARQITLTHKHHLDEDDDLFCVGLQSQEAASHALPEVSEGVGILATHNIKHLLCQFEWCRLKLDSLAGRIGQQEAKVDMQHVTLNVDQDVLIVSVLDLQDVADKTVGAQGVGKVLNSLLIALPTGLAILRVEVVHDCRIGTCLLLYRRD